MCEKFSKEDNPSVKAASDDKELGQVSSEIASKKATVSAKASKDEPPAPDDASQQSSCKRGKGNFDFNVQILYEV